MRTMHKLGLAAVASALILGFAACSDGGDYEAVGPAVDGSSLEGKKDTSGADIVKTKTYHYTATDTGAGWVAES